MDEQISLFSEYLLTERNYSDHTDINYIHDLDIYANYIKNKRISYQNITYRCINNYINYLKEDKKLEPNSINRNLSALRSFYNFLVRQNTIKSNPFNLIKSQKKQIKLPNYIKYSEFEEIVNLCDESPLGIRNRCLIELLFATGCRISELINIKITDINLINKDIKVKGKGNKERIVYFNDISKKYLNIYINEMRPILLNNKTNEYLLINHIGTKLTDRGVRDIINKLLLKCSINKKVSPHTFRHTFATMLLNEGCDLKSVQELLGHANLSTTSIYTHLSNDRIKDVYLHSHPRAKNKI